MAYDQTSTTELGVDSSPSPLSFQSGSEKPFKTNAEDKFRVRLAAEGYDENGTMKYREYSTDDTDDDNRNTKGSVTSCVRQTLEAEVFPCNKRMLTTLIINTQARKPHKLAKLVRSDVSWI